MVLMSHWGNRFYNSIWQVVVSALVRNQTGVVGNQTGKVENQTSAVGNQTSVGLLFPSKTLFVRNLFDQIRICDHQFRTVQN
jgi:hypothetical protein